MEHLYMAAYVEGIVIANIEESDTLVVKCGNGNIVEIITGDFIDKETKEDMLNLIDERIKIEGEAYFEDGKIKILANEVKSYGDRYVIR